MRISDWSSDVCSSDLPHGKACDVFVRGIACAQLPQCQNKQRLNEKQPCPPLAKPVRQERNFQIVHQRRPQELERVGRGKSDRERQSVGEGKSGSVRVDLGGGSIIKKKNTHKNK